MTHLFLEGVIIGLFLLPGIASAFYLVYEAGVVKGEKAADGGGDDQ